MECSVGGCGAGKSSPILAAELSEYRGFTQSLPAGYYAGRFIGSVQPPIIGTYLLAYLLGCDGTVDPAREVNIEHYVTA